jgi:hypothetical protein
MKKDPRSNDISSLFRYATQLFQYLSWINELLSACLRHERSEEEVFLPSFHASRLRACVWHPQKLFLNGRK